MQITPLLAFEDNYIWVITSQQSNAVVIVDPGDADVVNHYLFQQKRRLLAILLTHHHGDHTQGAEELAAQHNARVYGHKNRIAAVSHPVNEGETITFNEVDLTITVWSTPGHTCDHLSYYSDHQDGLLFCGDTLFSAGCGRIFDGSALTLYQSLTRIAALPATTKLYPTHEYTLANLKFAAIAEPNNHAINNYRNNVEKLIAEQIPSLPTTVATELAVNPFLHNSDITLRRRAEIFCNHPINGDAEQFAVVRAWKDSLD
ncbi:MAG: hydroxyacylglutathione hydrolase [Gammaproteobacteria bacterium]|nr:hydroxyacylglutathione hydrolase [Gammaproteobacteria bacterium]